MDSSSNRFGAVQGTSVESWDGARRLEGLRCLRCTGPIDSRGDEVACASCGALFRIASGGIVETSAENGAFVHGLDREVDALVRLLDGVAAPVCTEQLIAEFAESADADIGNPAWEGRADVARLVDGAHGVALDIGAGFGTIATAVARSAAHVYALDKSPGRARVTAARARAEGLENVTAVHADGSTLPLGSGVCDLALLVGVLEWTGMGAKDPVASQRAVLAEAARVLKKDGTLLIGIENRFGAHYFLGQREEHTKLRFASLLPRRLADLYCRLLQGRRMTTYTHSRRALLGLVRDAGLEPRIGVALPSYSEPRLSFDQEDFDRAWSFYLRHVFHYSSTFRRVGGAVARLVPARVLIPIVPTFWLVAGKRGRPGRIPTVVTGSGDCAAEMKVVDWEGGQVLRLERRTGRLQERVPFIDGWSARNWISSPFRRRSRLRRQSAVLREAGAHVAARGRRPVTEEVRERCVREALAGLELIRDALAPETLEWCRGQVSVLEAGELPMVEEHSDFATVNLIVEEPTRRLRHIDGKSGPSYGVVGLDGVVLATDVLSLKCGRDHRNLDVALSEVLRAPLPVLEDTSRLLWGDFGPGTPVPLAVALTVGAVLRYAHNNEPLPGIGTFLDRAAAGELRLALERLEPVEPTAQLEPVARAEGFAPL
jgi:SAM-dependent methyltransferase